MRRPTDHHSSILHRPQLQVPDREHQPRLARLQTTPDKQTRGGPPPPEQGSPGLRHPGQWRPRELSGLPGNYQTPSRRNEHRCRAQRRREHHSLPGNKQLSNLQEREELSRLAEFCFCLYYRTHSCNLPLFAKK